MSSGEVSGDINPAHNNIYFYFAASITKGDEIFRCETIAVNGDDILAKQEVGPTTDTIKKRAPFTVATHGMRSLST